MEAGGRQRSQDEEAAGQEGRRAGGTRADDEARRLGGAVRQLEQRLERQRRLVPELPGQP